MKTLRDLFEHELQDLYSAESQLIDAIPKMAEAASNTKLKKAFKDHLKETEEQKERLKEIGKILDIDLTGHTCKAMKGLIKEGESMIEEDADENVRDAGLIACAQRVEHYEIAGYGTARHYAQMLDEGKVGDLLEETLNQEKSADEKLNDLAIEKINEKAMADTK